MFLRNAEYMISSYRVESKSTLTIQVTFLNMELTLRAVCCIKFCT